MALTKQQAEVEKFTAYLNRPPDQEQVRVNKHAANTLYLPISHIETLLDELFLGLWETRDFRYTVMGNEIAGSIELRVFHPKAETWINRTGAAATMIRQQKGAGVTEFEKKIHNALEMDFPHLKADCMSNAARSLGKLFGRDLNRVFTDNYRPLYAASIEAAGAITQSVDDNRAMSKALAVANSLLEQMRVEDQVYSSLILRLANCESEAHVYSLCDEIKQLLPPSPDPQRQLKEWNKT